MARILIVGCGKLGTPLGINLASEGHTVTGIRRTLVEPAPSEIEWLVMDITDPAHYQRLPQQADIMVVILTPAGRSPQGYRSIYQTGLEGVLDHYKDCAVRPWILFVSATSVYGQQAGEWVDENSPTEPQQYNGQSLLAAEQAVLALNPESVNLRFSGIYGAARSRVISKLETPQEIQQSPPLYSNRIHQDDCIGVLHFLVSERIQGNPLDSVYLATDHDCAEKFDVMSWLANAAHLVSPTPTVAAPDAPQNKRCSNARLVKRGYVFKYRGYRDGYRAMLDAQGQP